MLRRFYTQVLSEHLQNERQMALVAGPRQVGKTTTCRNLSRRVDYLNWDDQDDRRVITRGVEAVVQHIGLHVLREGKQLLVLDELHKYRRWKLFLKGLFDKHGDQLHVVVTGSARMDVYRRGGDSLMGRYFLYRMHPLSVGELVRPAEVPQLIRKPKKLDAARAKVLWEYGGYPEPFSRADRRFSSRWQRLRVQQLVREDLRDLTRIQELDQLELLVRILQEHSGAQMSYSSLAREINVSVDTVRRWVSTLTALHHGFLVRPWHRNVRKSLRKEPKYFLRDWSVVSDPGGRAETYVACHLLKAVQTWEDLGLGTFALHYLRDRQKREVDFVVIRDEQPWFLVEVKRSDTSLAPSLAYFQQELSAPHAFQVVIEHKYVGTDPFSRSGPLVVPAATLLSQLP